MATAQLVQRITTLRGLAGLCGNAASGPRMCESTLMSQPGAASAVVALVDAGMDVRRDAAHVPAPGAAGEGTAGAAPRAEKAMAAAAGDVQKQGRVLDPDALQVETSIARHDVVVCACSNSKKRVHADNVDERRPDKRIRKWLSDLPVENMDSFAQLEAHGSLGALSVNTTVINLPSRMEPGSKEGACWIRSDDTELLKRALRTKQRMKVAAMERLSKEGKRMSQPGIEELRPLKKLALSTGRPAAAEAFSVGPAVAMTDANEPASRSEVRERRVAAFNFACSLVGERPNSQTITVTDCLKWSLTDLRRICEMANLSTHGSSKTDILRTVMNFLASELSRDPERSGVRNGGSQ
ncbi:hypothetical protein FVE85_3212 [Porphyridium purpureum]|uniref:Uncharacterized protein n=1 Tax=Porphyridium purpureum TaxID=35688 RepID=A0A5J4YTY3_PORPP|nr:hypothetical protein FVE85_3212 [Porphyridium purpureum]|eukprot:POR3141..scf227_4